MENLTKKQERVLEIYEEYRKIIEAGGRKTLDEYLKTMLLVEAEETNLRLAKIESEISEANYNAGHIESNTNNLESEIKKVNESLSELTKNLPEGVSEIRTLHREVIDLLENMNN